jgi:D-alanyl-D-alanine carboxypeptidase
MTLYVAYQALENGEVSLDDAITVSSNAANVQGVELEFLKDTLMSLRHLIRASAVGGANDASMALAEGLSNSEELFAQRMNSTAKALGLTRSAWKNPHGLTEKGHMSSAKDLANLFIAHRRDFPQYFNLLSRRTTDAGIREVANSSRRLLSGVKGVHGAKYGYTHAAGNSGVVFVEREGKRIVAVVLGEMSMAKLLARMNAIVDAAFEKLLMN